ncbi:DDE-domain-containing protein, partial [Fistulina hepatica ATCC 64428]
MDESSFPHGNLGKEQVIRGCGTKTQHKQGGADCENVTALCIICADGSIIPPQIVYKSKNYQPGWFEVNITNAIISKLECGWTNSEIGLIWLKDMFNKHTREKANGRTRVLILDGHSSHYSLDFIHYAHQNNIVILAYPPHCTHTLQGLDIICFAQMKTCWHEEIQAFEDAHMKSPTKADFTSLFGRAFIRAFMPDTVRAAFTKTGIYPYNPNIISIAQSKPSILSSIKGTFPLPMPLPVHAIMAAFSTRLPTTFNDVPNHASADAQSSNPHANLNEDHSMPINTTFSVQRHKWVLDVDPKMFTLCKRLRSMYALLGSTSSGSFLVSNVKVTSVALIAHPVVDHMPSELPIPNWSILDMPEDTSKM